MKSAEDWLTDLLEPSLAFLPCFSLKEVWPLDKRLRFLCASFLKKFLAPATLGDFAIAFSMLENVLLLLRLPEKRPLCAECSSKDGECLPCVAGGIWACGLGEKLKKCLSWKPTGELLSDLPSEEKGGGFLARLLDVLEFFDNKLEPNEFGTPVLVSDTLLCEDVCLLWSGDKGLLNALLLLKSAGC